MIPRRRAFHGAFVAALLPLVLSIASAAPPATTPVIGLRENTPAVHALTNVRIVPEPGKVIEQGTIVIRDGVIEAVGAEVEPPADARTIDLAGKTAYAGLIDAYSEVTIAANPRLIGSPHWNPQVSPQFRVAEHFTIDQTTNSKLRSQGIAARLVAPATRIIKGLSIVVSTGRYSATKRSASTTVRG